MADEEVADDVAENLILPVPEFLSAVYLVPLALSAEAAKDCAAPDCLPAWTARWASPRG